MNTPTNASLREELLRSALAAATRGWHVFPLAPGAKHPGLKGNWQDLATTNAAQIEEWWARKPWNIGIACGPSALVVLDLDVPGHARPAPGTRKGEPDGTEALARLCAEQHQPYPAATFTVRTPSGGTHLYFTAPDTPVGNSASKLAPLIDIRADGGYIVVPASRTPAGPYTILSPAPPAPFPPWIAGLLKTKTTTSSPERIIPAPPAPTTGYAEAALASEYETVATAAEGTRNDTLNRSAFNLGQLAAAGILADAQITATLTDAARAAGLAPREIPATIRSGLSAGKRHPRHFRATAHPPEPRIPSNHAPLPRR